MQKRTIGIIATVISALVCGFTSLFAGIWGILIASGTPIDITSNGTTTSQTVSPTIGYALLLLTVVLILVPVVIGYFTFRKKS